MDVSKDIVWHEQSVDRAMREQRLGQLGCVIWFTGLSGCGKSTVANALDVMLSQAGRATTLLDGDNVRHGLCSPPSVLEPEHGTEFQSDSDWVSAPSIARKTFAASAALRR